jgi:ER membrane protein complex subunit 3
LSDRYAKGAYLKTPTPNPSSQAGEGGDDMPQLPPQLQDPAQTEAMMEGMKKNMFMMIPQMFIMGWVSTFFSGFVLSTFLQSHPQQLFL